MQHSTWVSRFQRILPGAVALSLACVAAPSLAQSLAQSPAQSLAQAENSPTTQYPARQPLTARAQDIVAVFRGEKPADAVFAPVFLAQVSPAQLAQLYTSLSQQYGQIEEVERLQPTGPNSADLTFRFAKALGQAKLVVDPASPHLVTGLLITGFTSEGDSAEKLRADLQALPGDIGVLYTRIGALNGARNGAYNGARNGAYNGARNAMGGSTGMRGEVGPMFALAENDQFAIGSTFKLYVLSALARSIERGERRWGDVVTLDRHSFPSGQMQEWPIGTQVTLDVLASMMISISDNTATDMLMAVVGRDAVEAELRATGHSDPDKSLPFMTTLQMFALKGDPALLSQYAQAGARGDENAQRAILRRIDAQAGGDPKNITPPRFTAPTAIDTVEWFASGRDMQRLLARIVVLRDPRAREILAINPSLPPGNLAKFPYAGFKGGSEPGVLNTTWLLQDKAGDWRMLTLSWNNPASNVDKVTLELLAMRILDLPDFNQ